MTNGFDRRSVMAGVATCGFAAAAPQVAKAQDTPPLPPAPTPQQWARPSAIRFARLSPGGRQICYMTEKDAVKYLYTFDLATQQMRSINMGNSDVSEVRWIDETHVLVSGLMPARYTIGGGNWKGQRQISTVFNLETVTQNILFSNMPAFDVFVLSSAVRIKRNGKFQVAALSTKKDPHDAYTYLYAFDLDGTRSEAMDQATNAINWILTPEGEMVARICYDYPRRRWSIDYRKNGNWKEIYHFDVERNFPGALCLAADGESLVVSIPSSGEINDLHTLSPNGTLSAPLVEHGTNRRPTVDPVTYRHNGFARYDGWVKYEYADPVWAEVARKAQVAMGDYRMTIASTGDNPMQAIIYSEGVDDAGTFYYIDFATRKPVEVGICYPDIPLEWIASKEAITYKAADGLDIPAYLTLPPNKPAKGLPLIVYPHSGPADNDGDGVEWVVQALASSGYAVLQPNYRGSTRFGEAFIAAGNGEYGGKMLSDLSDGVAYLAGQGTVDAKRVAIFGSGGYAGYAALAGVSLQSGVYACAIASAPITDLQLYRMTNIGNETSPSYRYFRKLVGESTELDSISPAQHAGQVAVPVMLIHSEEETGIDIQQSRKMASALKSAKKPHEFIEFKAEDNWALVEKSRVEFITYVTGFLQKHNPA